MRERPIIFSAEMVRAILEGRKTQTRRVVRPQPGYIKSWPPACPYGQPGDRLWVRETCYIAPVPGKPVMILGRAADGDHPHGQPYRVLPSIHMPRWASRITLEITGVRVERVQEITEEQAIAEGVEPGIPCPGGRPLPSDRFLRTNGHGNVTTSAQHTFKKLWDSINAARGFGWDKNPWVWVIEFKRLPCP